MTRFKKVGEFYTENAYDDQKIKDSLASIGYSVCWLDEYGNGNHYVVMEEIKDGSNS